MFKSRSSCDPNRLWGDVKSFSVFSLQECFRCCCLVCFCADNTAAASDICELCFLKTDPIAPVMDWRCEDKERVRSTRKRAAWVLLSWKPIKSQWWIISIRQPLPRGINVHMLHKDCTGTRVDQQHDSSWLTGCGIRWGVVSYICQQWFLFTQNRISCRTHDWNLWCFWSEFPAFSGFWIFVFVVSALHGF